MVLNRPIFITNFEYIYHIHLVVSLLNLNMKLAFEPDMWSLQILNLRRFRENQNQTEEAEKRKQVPIKKNKYLGLLALHSQLRSL